MKHYIEVPDVRRITTAITCDRCGRKVEWETDPFEWQEFHHINFRGGFGSVFGDELKCECDLCQHCLKELVGQWMRYPEVTKEAQ